MTPASSFPEADLTVDGTGLLCETLLLRLREKIGDAPPGTVVHAVATDPAAPLGLPAWCHLTGHTYLGGRPRTVAVPLTWTAVRPPERIVVHAGRMWDSVRQELRRDVDIVVEGYRMGSTALGGEGLS